MKKVITMMCIALCIAGAFADNPPPPVKGVFQTKFSSATNVAWGQERPDEWIANFSWKGEGISAIFSTDGMWLETLHEINMEDLPAVAAAIIKNSFKDWAILEVDKAETSRYGNVYEVDLRKGVVRKEVMMKADGTILKIR